MNKTIMFRATVDVGFIESRITRLLLKSGDYVIGITDFNDVYPPNRWRLLKLQHFLAEDKQADFQLSPDAACKKGTESLAYIYHSLYRLSWAIELA